MKPKLEASIAANPEVLFFAVDVDENEETGQDAGVSSLPTFQFFKDGAKVGETIGAKFENVTAKIESMK